MWPGTADVQLDQPASRRDKGEEREREERGRAAEGRTHLDACDVSRRSRSRREHEARTLKRMLRGQFLREEFEARGRPSRPTATTTTFSRVPCPHAGVW